MSIPINSQGHGFYCPVTSKTALILICDANIVGVKNGKFSPDIKSFKILDIFIYVDLQPIFARFLSPPENFSKENKCGSNKFINDISPNSGSPLGGQLVTISGCNLPFKDNISQFFGKKKVDVFFSRANYRTVCKIVEFLSSKFSIICETESFQADGRWKLEILDGTEEIKVEYNFLLFF